MSALSPRCQTNVTLMTLFLAFILLVWGFEPNTCKLDGSEILNCAAIGINHCLCMSDP